MTDQPPPGLSVDTPNVARMWDYQLGGKDNFAVDRDAVDELNEACRRAGVPDGRTVARENRAFLRRVVSYLAGEVGIGQFIDIGAGLPTRGNVHQIAQARNPDPAVVYVDNDEVVLAYGRALLADNRRTIVIQADLRQPDTILGHPQVRELIDLSRPVAVLLVAVLHLLPDSDDPAGIVTHLREAIAPGSYLAISHATNDAHPDTAAKVQATFTELRVTTPLIPRSRHAIAGFFDGLDLVKPGLVHPSRWRPDPTDTAPADTAPADLGGGHSQWMYVGVGRKPSHPSAAHPSAAHPSAAHPSAAPGTPIDQEGNAA